MRLKLVAFKLSLLTAKQLGALFVIVLIGAVAQTGVTVHAQGLVGGIPFAGRIVAPAYYPFLFPGCPPHVIVMKQDQSIVTQSPIMGLYALPGSFVYQDFNLITPGVWELGTYAPFVLLPPVCPYPVAPIEQVGTGLFPGP